MRKLRKLRTKQGIGEPAYILKVSSAYRTGSTFVPDEGVLVWDIGTNKLYVGDGSTAGGKQLKYE